MLSSTLRRIGPDGQTIDAGDLPLAEAFFDPSIKGGRGITPRPLHASNAPGKRRFPANPRRPTRS